MSRSIDVGGPVSPRDMGLSPMFSSDGLDFPSFWNKELRVLFPGSVLLLCRDCDNHSVHARRLGRVGRRIPSYIERVAFLMKDLVLFAVSFYLLKQDMLRVSLAANGCKDRFMAEKIAAGISSAGRV